MKARLLTVEVMEAAMVVAATETHQQASPPGGENPYRPLRFVSMALDRLIATWTRRLILWQGHQRLVKNCRNCSGAPTSIPLNSSLKLSVFPSSHKSSTCWIKSCRAHGLRRYHLATFQSTSTRQALTGD